MQMRFETRYTYDFVKRFLPNDCRRILEIGCGTGELAACLSRDGHDVVAIDIDPESVAAAQRLGVDSRVARWPDFNDGCFDAVLFTRSLHHIHPLDLAVRHAAGTLQDRGTIIVEDFAYESADEKTLRWFVSAVHLLEATGLLPADDFLKTVLSKTATLKAWRQNHKNELHTAAEINAQLEKTGRPVIKEDAACYFRYVAGAITRREKSDAILQAFAKQEQMLSGQGAITALGRRFVIAPAR
ncbi:MAG TPA: methyltransferase domain-containing protein [Candidatus Udaeobacter sp.]|jgi:SAM-dependent methyltransferase